MKAAGLISDKPLYYCIMTSLLSKAAVARETVFNDVLQVTSEMADQSICIDLATAKQWQRFLMKAERRPGELTRAVERVFPPDRKVTAEGARVKEKRDHAGNIPTPRTTTKQNGSRYQTMKRKD